MRAATASNVVRRIFPLRVVVGLSGGVDSSVTALLLKRAGFSVAGCFMRNWDRADEVGAGLPLTPCSVEADYASAAAVARALDIPLLRADFSADYWHEVFERSLEAFSRGMTPNPDAACNRFIKFGAFRDRALHEFGADIVATGHYAQIWPEVARDPFAPLPLCHTHTHSVSLLNTSSSSSNHHHAHSSPRLLSAIDGTKDQSDFLSLVPGAAFSRVAFPLGRYTKAAVRALASEAKLPTATRKDSMGLCFIGPRNMPEFLSKYLTPTQGIYLDLEEASTFTTLSILGTVECTEALTVGQGARLAGGGSAARSGSNLAPLFIVSNGLTAALRTTITHTASLPPHPPTAAVWLVPGRDHTALYSNAVAVDIKDFNWVAGKPPLELEAAVQAAETRRRHHRQENTMNHLTPSSLNQLDKLSPLEEALGLRFNNSHSGDAVTVAVVNSLSRWLSVKGSAEEPSPFPSLRLIFRDRHGGREVHYGTATIVWRSEFGSACATLPSPNRIAAYRQQTVALKKSNDTFSRKVQFIPTWAATLCHENVVGEGIATTVENNNDSLLLVIRFDTPHRAVTPGQVLVLYTAAIHQLDVNGDNGDDDDNVNASAKRENLVSLTRGGENLVWEGANRIVIGGGPILCSAPSLWEQDVLLF